MSVVSTSALLLAAAALVGATGPTVVQLNVATSPSTVNVGGSTSAVGSGFPAGAITPANVNIYIWSPNCDGSIVATTTATKVTNILGSTKKVQFVVPSLSTGSYTVSLDGVNDNGDAFVSGNRCSIMNVQ